MHWKIKQNFSQKINKKAAKSGLKQYLKEQEQKKIQKIQIYGRDKKIQYKAFSQMKLIYLQFMPCIFMLSPCIYNFASSFDLMFLAGSNMTQIYLSCLLLVHSNFKRNYNKMILTLGAITIANLLPGVYSIISPLIMMFLAYATPLRLADDPQKLQVTQNEKTRVQVLMKIKALYFFSFVFLTLLKLMHFQQVNKLQKKMLKIDQQNKIAKTSQN